MSVHASILHKNQEICTKTISGSATIFRVGEQIFSDTKLKWNDKLYQNTDWIPDVQKFRNTNKFVNLLTDTIFPTSEGGGEACHLLGYATVNDPVKVSA